ncbi:MAG: ADP-ribosylglycohydrolase family protein [Phaeodactylibacter sp.]|nr:ADP-ribosylglycohydrolase family protein [Phaeodactylibacter sp.]MCB9297089.1 ADP-ribosylglycohydrolase family protein [Lewinellaceae bacterium]
MEYPVKSALFGLAVGDALGVPVEFVGRSWLKRFPVDDMRGHGTHDQPPGTWSDDSSMSFCLAESLCQGYDLNDIAEQFLAWCYGQKWTPHGEVFDIGNATLSAIERLRSRQLPPQLAGGMDEGSNGNGSLMRILPLLFYTYNRPVEERYALVSDVSSITHAHFRSVFSCFVYLEVARQLLRGRHAQEAYEEGVAIARQFAEAQQFNRRELFYFSRTLQGKLPEVHEDNIYSSGYVVHTLEASLWSLLTTSSYSEAVLRAVNLGEDTDTSGAVTGGLAGLAYGFDDIPADWVEQLARVEDIEYLCVALAGSICG